MPSVLFVCLGNICRSPAGENVLHHLLRQRNAAGAIDIDSAGTADWHMGKAPDSRMSATLSARNIEVSGSARQFRVEDFERFDLIVPMDESNRSNILKLAPNEAARAKVRPFVTFCSRHELNEIPDPWSGEQDGFELVVDLMEDGCAGIIEELLSPQSLS